MITSFNFSQPSDHVELIGFDKEKSIFNKKANAFDKLYFKLSEEPTSEWIDVFLRKKYDPQSKSEVLFDYSFYNKQISSSNNANIQLKDLQDYIDKLKERFHLTNSHFIELEEKEKHNDETYNKTIDSLKF